MMHAPFWRRFRLAPAVAGLLALAPCQPLAQDQPPAREAREEPGKTAGMAAAGRRQKVEMASQSGDPELDAQSGFFAEFPGFDLDPLTPAKRQLLLLRANKAYCTCGCRGDTVARCVALDPSCQTARKMLQKMIDTAQARTPDGGREPGQESPTE